MKRTFILFFTLVSIFSYSNAQMTEYIADSGHKFYYFESAYQGHKERYDVEFIMAQDIFANAHATLDEAEKVEERAEKDYKDQIEALYNKNKDYMWEHFPDYKYTFEEVYEEVRAHSWKTNYRDFDDNTFTCTIQARIVRKLKKNKLFNKPYILGYIYIDDETKHEIAKEVL